MDKRIKYRIVLDTETTTCDKDVQEVNPYNMFVYDIDWAVVDRRGNVYETRSYVNADIFCDEKELMKSAYYAEKIPKYWEEIKSGERQLAKWYAIVSDFKRCIKEWGVNEVYAHNMRFDYGTLQTTQRWLTKSKYRFFFPYGVTICDTLKMARDVLGNSRNYKHFCEDNDYLTANGKPRMTAEVLYRYITGDTNFVEEHTGLADVLIEKEIMAYLFSRNKPMRRTLFEN